MTQQNDALKNALNWQDLAAVKSIVKQIDQNHLFVGDFDNWPFHRFCEHLEILNELEQYDWLHGLWDSHVCYNCTIDNVKFRAWFLKGPFVQMVKQGSHVFKFRILSDMQSKSIEKSVSEIFNAFAPIIQSDDYIHTKILVAAVKHCQINTIKLILRNQHFYPFKTPFYIVADIADAFLAFVGKCESPCNKIESLRAGKRLVTKDMYDLCVGISALKLPVLLQCFLLEFCLEPFSFCTPYGWFDCVAQLVVKAN